MAKSRNRSTSVREKKSVAAITHDEAHRRNIPTAEYRSVMKQSEQSPIRVAYERRDRDLDPQLVWRGKDQRDWTDLVVHAPPIYIQEKVHPKVLIDDLQRETRSGRLGGDHPKQADLFLDFNGLPKSVDKTEFYRHDQNWTNRMILGDSLQVMASLAEREGLRGKVQCIYFDPPYGIKFNSNFQWSTTSRDVKDGNASHITREPEQVKAFRDTWRDGIHSYLSYLRDRLTVARDLLTETGSIFVQIGDENVHRMRAVLDEVFGSQRYVNTIVFKKKSATSTTESVFDYILWYCRSRDQLVHYPLYERRKTPDEDAKFNTLVTEPMVFHRVADLKSSEVDALIARGAKWARVNYPIVSQHPSETRSGDFIFRGQPKECGANSQWRYGIEDQMPRLEKAGRLYDGGGRSLGGVVFWDDWNHLELANIWEDMHGEKKPIYVVQTTTSAIERCIHLVTKPGDLVLDPTCGSGTTAYVCEQWGRRWITIDTSRVALALARTRIMGARYPYYLLADSEAGAVKEAEISGRVPIMKEFRGDIRLGFVTERVPRVQMGDIADNVEIDIIHDTLYPEVSKYREALNKLMKCSWKDWDVPRDPDPEWSSPAKKAHAAWLAARVKLQREIDASIEAHTPLVYLHNHPYPERKTVRVAGPFTVESLSPHRMLAFDEDDGLIDHAHEATAAYRVTDRSEQQSFPLMVLENLRVAGVQQAKKGDKINFVSLVPWPGDFICADGRYLEGTTVRRAAVFIGPEFGTVQRADLVQAAKEAGDADFDMLIACAFNYEAHATDLAKLGRLPVLKARMNADLHMSEDLKSTSKGNLFVVFGEPVIKPIPQNDGLLRVQIECVSVFDPQTGEVRSDGPDGIACWFIDTEYNEESFFVRHAYFLGANDPYTALKTTLRAEINKGAWETLHSDTSRPFRKPNSGRIAVKVINHLGDEVMKVFRV